MANHEFTGVFIPAHIWLSKELEPAEKMLLGEIEALSKKTGWCSAGRKHFAEWLNCSEPNVSYYTAKLERMGFVEVKRTPGFGSKMRVVFTKFYADQPVNEIYGGSKPGLRGVVNGVYGGSKEALPVNTIEIQNNKERGEKEKNALSPSENQISLEAGKEKKAPPVAPAPPAGTRLEIYDPATPGAAILDIVSSEPQTQPPLQRIELGSRATAETPTELETALRAFYKDWPNEWSVGVLENGRGGRYGQEKRAQIVKDFCCWAVENNRQRDTFRQLNASLQKWFRNEEHATWKQKPASTTNTPATDSNFYRRSQQTK